MSDDLRLPERPGDATGPVLVGFSGGLDSSVLLHALAARPALRARGLQALHVHHGLQPDADAWAAHCQRQALRLGVPLKVVSADVRRDSGEGLEAAARRARYHAFAEALGADGVLVTAHHLDDQAETFLLRALRASGVDGLGAMRGWRRFATGWHWRPLLDRTRAELQAHAHRHGLEWIEDPSNARTDADRNFLRHQVLPLLAGRWAQAPAALARSAALSAEAAALLHDGDADALAACHGGAPDLLRVGALMALPAARRARVLRLWIERLGLAPLPASGVTAVEATLLQARADAEARHAWSDAAILRWRDLLHACRPRPVLPQEWQTWWDGRAALPLPDGARLRLVARDGAAATPAFDAPLRVHARQGGERIRLPGRAHRHVLKDLLLQHAIPPWQRQRLPLLSNAQDELLAAGDRIVAAPLQAWLDARALALRWEPDPSPRTATAH